MPIEPDETDAGGPLPYWLERRDMPDGRTRLHLLRDVPSGDIHEINVTLRPRVIDRSTGRPVLSLWLLDCLAEDEWRDGALHLRIQPADLDLRIDLARGEFRAAGSEPRPLDGLQAFVESAVGDGFGVKKAEAALEPERERAWRRAQRRERLQVIGGFLLLVAFLIFLGWMLYTDPQSLRLRHFYR